MSEPSEESRAVPTAHSKAVSNTTSMTSNERETQIPISESNPLKDEEISKVSLSKMEAKSNDEEEVPLVKALTKAELMPFATDPFWVKLRWTLFILFWLSWIAMLAAAIAIIVLAPKCPPPAPKDWWQKAPIYQVYAPSFKDNNGDGFGDLKGMTSKLEYLVNLGIESVSLSSIYRSPKKERGSDIQDFEAIDPDFGTLEDFEEMIQAMHDRGLKLIMDFIPNHSSENHEWFQKSILKESEYADYYIWKEGSPDKVPNNWKSIFGGSAWEWHPIRKAWYLHQFKKSQPDFNLRNPKVTERLKNAMRFWLNKGVDGFRFTSVSNMFEAEDFSDEASSGLTVQNGANDYVTLTHTKTVDLPEDYDLLKEFREILDDYTVKDASHSRIMMTESYESDIYNYYGVNGSLSHIPLNFNFISNFPNKKSVSASAIQKLIDEYNSQIPHLGWPNFVLGSIDNSRLASRIGPEFVDAMNMIVLLLPGSPITYYGEELGMMDSFIKNPADSRDPYRAPMLWTNEEFAGFSNKSSWMNISKEIEENNVIEQGKNVNSHLSIYMGAAKLRSSDSILYGELINHVFDDVYVLARARKGNPGFAVVVNFGASKTEVDLSSLNTIPEEGTILLVSQSQPQKNSLSIGSRIQFTSLSLEPHDALIISYVPNFKK